MAENSGGKVVEIQPANAADVRVLALATFGFDAKTSLFASGKLARYEMLADALEALTKANAGCGRNYASGENWLSVCGPRVQCALCATKREDAIALLTQEAP